MDAKPFLTFGTLFMAETYKAFFAVGNQSENPNISRSSDRFNGCLTKTLREMYERNLFLLYLVSFFLVG